MTRAYFGKYMGVVNTATGAILNKRKVEAKDGSDTAEAAEKRLVAQLEGFKSGWQDIYLNDKFEIKEVRS